MRQDRFRKKNEEQNFFDLEEVERIENAEIASEPDADEEEASPDLREFTPREMARMYQDNRDLIEREAKYRLSLYRGSHLLVNYDDLIQEGFLGFLQGARKYDETKGASLRTYAGYWVRKRIRQTVKESIINYQYLDYAANWEHTPWRSGVIMSEAEFTFENDYFRTSARLPVFDSNPEAIVSRREKKSRVCHAIDQCSDRERKYMDYRYGFDGTNGHSWRKSRDHFGQHEQRGEDIEFGLRYNMEQRLGYGFYDFAEEYWMPHNSGKTDYKWQRYVVTIENEEIMKRLNKEKARNRMRMKSTLTLHRMTEEEKHIIHGWRYTDEYTIYNMPSYEEYKEKGSGLRTLTLSDTHSMINNN